jgi:hypothetical protein
VVVLRAIRDAERVREELRTYVESCRTSKRVREIDIE